MDSDSTTYTYQLRQYNTTGSTVSDPKNFQDNNSTKTPSSLIPSYPRLITLFLIGTIILLIFPLFISLIQFLSIDSKNKAVSLLLASISSKLGNITTAKAEVLSKYDIQYNINNKLLNETNKFNNISSIIIMEMNHMKDKINTNYQHYTEQLTQSTIIESADELVSLIKWLPQSSETDPSNIKLQLIYKGTKDGDSLEAFHAKCDYKSPLVVMVKTKDDNFRFGAFTMQNFSSDNKKSNTIQVNDPYTFFFSFDSMKRYDVNNYFTGIKTGMGVYFNFGNVFIVKPDWIKERNKGFLTYTFCLELTDERFPYRKTLFTPEEIEVYHVAVIKT